MLPDAMHDHKKDEVDDVDVSTDLVRRRVLWIMWKDHTNCRPPEANTEDAYRVGTASSIDDKGNRVSRYGDTAYASFVLAPDATEEDLAQFCQSVLSISNL